MQVHLAPRAVGLQLGGEALVRRPFGEAERGDGLDEAALAAEALDHALGGAVMLDQAGVADLHQLAAQRSVAAHQADQLADQRGLATEGALDALLRSSGVNLFRTFLAVRHSGLLDPASRG